MAPSQMNHDDIDYSSTSVTNDNHLRVRRLCRHIDLRTRDDASTTVNRQHRQLQIAKL